MKKEKLKFLSFDKLEILSGAQLKQLMGGLNGDTGIEPGCLNLGEACQDDIQCCSNHCGESCKCEKSPS